jgi:glycosyltransferase involved in cell wall biosynthesis
MSLTVLSVSYSLAQVSTRTAGGAEQILAIIDQALVRAGHRSLVLAPAGSRCKGLLVPAQFSTGILHEDIKHQAWQTFRKLLERTLNEYAIDVVHMHGLDFYEYLPDIDVPVIVSLHLPLSWYPAEALRIAERNLTFVSVSKSQAATAPAGMPPSCVIPNGVDLANFHSARRKSNYAVALARICPEKGLHLAIDAAERAGVELIIAGSVFEYPEHRNYFDSMIVPRVNRRIRFVGPIGAASKADLLAGARCLLVPSLAPETSSLVAMEALASGTPVIAFPNGALAEIVTPERTGFLVNDAEEMGDAIQRTSSISPVTCRREAEQRFSSERMISQYFDLYCSVRNQKNIFELHTA